MNRRRLVGKLANELPEGFARSRVYRRTTANGCTPYVTGGFCVGRITVRGYPLFDRDPRRAPDSSTKRLFGGAPRLPGNQTRRNNVG